MTILEAITQLQDIKPHQYDDETVVRWLSELDGKLYEESVKWHEGCGSIAHGPYDANADHGSALMVGAPYENIYLDYCCAQIDYRNGEIDRYSNSMVMFSVSQAAYADWFNRSHMPKQVRISI